VVDATDNLDMAHYRCPHCEDVVDLDGLARVTWCNACGQPLSMYDLRPLRPTISAEAAEPQDETPRAVA
jgi:DNA-directed RNA polymerase subunit RPC12/RpoP